MLVIVRQRIIIVLIVDYMDLILSAASHSPFLKAFILSFDFKGKISSGECKLENMRTLCVACHADVTAAQCAERRSLRIKAKKQLKVIMNSLRDDVKRKNTSTYSEV